MDFSRYSQHQRIGYLLLVERVAVIHRVKPDAGMRARQIDAFQEVRQKAAVWLANATPTDTTQAAAFRLLVKAQDAEPAKTLQAEINQFMARQNRDGGWGQLKDSASDAYATGQALYVLSLAGAKGDREEVRRAVKYLVDSQKEDGSWPMKRRGHAGVTPSDNVVPITYFGSAWATLGLLGAAAR